MAMYSSSVSSGDQADVGLPERAHRGFDPGKRGAQVVAHGGEQRRALLVRGGELRCLARLRAEPLRVERVLSRRGEGLQHALVLGEQAGAAAHQPQPGPDRDVEAQRRLLAGRRPSHLVDHVPLAVPARLQRHGLHPERLPGALEHTAERLALLELASRQLGERRRLAGGLLRRCPRLAASSTAPLTTAATTRKISSASACSPWPRRACGPA